MFVNGDTSLVVVGAVKGSIEGKCLLLSIVLVNHLLNSVFVAIPVSVHTKSSQVKERFHDLKSHKLECFEYLLCV